jgi:hypothetical protein
MSEKLAAYFTLALLLTARSDQASRASVKARIASPAVLALGVSLVIEAVQAFMPLRVPSLTDPILAVVGALAGGFACLVMEDFHRFAVRGAQHADETLPFSERRVPLGLVDSVIASLMEPHPQAPLERAPRRTPTQSD